VVEKKQKRQPKNPLETSNETDLAY